MIRPKPRLFADHRQHRDRPAVPLLGVHQPLERGRAQQRQIRRRHQHQVNFPFQPAFCLVHGVPGAELLFLEHVICLVGEGLLHGLRTITDDDQRLFGCAGPYRLQGITQHRLPQDGVQHLGQR